MRCLAAIKDGGIAFAGWENPVPRQSGHVAALFLGHPVFGDHAYDGAGRQLGGLNKRETVLMIELLKMMPRQALHAKTLGFIHPVTGESCLFESSLPDDMKRLLERLRKAREEGIP